MLDCALRTGAIMIDTTETAFAVSLTTYQLSDENSPWITHLKLTDSQNSLSLDTSPHTTSRSLTPQGF